MKFHEPLDNILGQQAKVRILRSLTLKGIELSGRQIAEETGLSHTGIHKALKDLVASHVLLERRAGKAMLFKFNQENYLVREILKPLFARENTILEFALESIIKKMRLPIVSLIIYGSLAMKKDTARSDIDLMVVVSPQNKTKAEQAFEQINDSFLAKYGRTISPYILTIKELQDKYRQKLPLILGVVKGGIVIQGRLISELLTYGR